MQDVGTPSEGSFANIIKQLYSSLLLSAVVFECESHFMSQSAEGLSILNCTVTYSGKFLYIFGHLMFTG